MDHDIILRELRDRVDRLERTGRAWRRGALALAGTALVLGTAAGVSAAPGGDARAERARQIRQGVELRSTSPDDDLVGSGFYATDGADYVHGRLAYNTEYDSGDLYLYHPNGEGGVLASAEPNESFMTFYDSHGNTRIDMGVDSHDVAYITMFSSRGRVVFRKRAR